MTIRRRGYRLVLGPVLALSATGLVAMTDLPGAHAASAQVGTCVRPNVAVLVQFPGATVGHGCRPAGGSGLALLESSGFAVTGTDQYGTAFVCKIAGQPAAVSCHQTPSAEEAWSYWHADPGASAWSHSLVGASSTVPRAGSADAWVVGVDPPSIGPSAVLPVAPPPTPPAPPASRRPAPAVAPPPAARTTVPSSTTPTPSASSAQTAEGARVPSALPDAASLPADSAAHEPSDAGTRPAAQRRGAGHGSATPAVVGGAVVALVAAGGGVATWRRRRGAHSAR